MDVNEPVRTCVGCGRKAPQRELVRFVAPDGLLKRDNSRQAPGRGAYTCARPLCFERAAANRAFARSLRRTVTIPTELSTDPWLTVRDH
jgi:predicted RNA-binding protein YlxR (DUF448 family)